MWLVMTTNLTTWRRTRTARTAATSSVLSIALAIGCGSKNEDPAQSAITGAAGTTMPSPAPMPAAGATSSGAGGMTTTVTSGSGGALPAGAGAGGAAQAGAGGAVQAGAGAGAGAGSGGATAEAGSGPSGDASAPDPSPGCTGGTFKAGHTNETIEAGGRQRQYVQHVPSTYDGTKPFSVLIDFHGGTYDGPRWDARASNKFKDMSETERFIYLAPTGLDAWWTTTEGADGADGLFMRALIDKLKQSACVDNRRIYTTGCSMGGDMSFFMACYFADVIAASLPMCGTMSFPLTDCKPARPISTTFVMGSRDSLNCWEPPRTSVGNPCASEVLAAFKMHNGCTDAAEMTHDGLCLTHDECSGGTEASICRLDATHTGIYQATDMDVYVEGWSFLKRFHLP
jgi:poly(3-hydroxybutyrate) depolymerase